MKSLRLSLVLLFTFFLAKGWAQDEWPKVITATDGSVLKVYHPQPESFSGNILKSRSAVSLLENGKTDPVFGTFWSVATVSTDRDNRVVSVQSVHVPNLKFADALGDDETNFLKTTLETQLPQVENNIPLDELLTSLNQDVEEKKLSTNLNNQPPKIIYSQNPSILVIIDGAPKFKRNDDWGVDVVVNTPYTLVKNSDGNFYLYGDKQWYTAANVMGPYNFVNDVPGNFQKIANAVNAANSSEPGYSDSAANAQTKISDIIVSTKPAELIQTNGTPQFTAIDGTNLQYASNSANDIFFDQGGQLYYVLISGRWYKSDQLDGPWQYTPSTSLPSDFAKIPEGSPKDNVLASVAGTQAAREAVMDAQIPQTAKVDRHSASTSVTYDGAPQFKNIPGTDLQYAVNSSSSVISYQGKYYAVDKGVWFVSDDPQGPWAVSTDRPEEVDNIPPTNPDYNLKYVYVYDSDPDWVYMGYTPGYLNSYIYGPTVVYGTGFYYNPWWGNYFYPGPYTWGFGINYNPWWGWGFGYNYSFFGFNYGFGLGIWGGWGGGWWGPRIYRPPFYGGAFYGRGYFHGGFYGPGGLYGRGGLYGGGLYGGARNININRTVINNNIYGLRRDVVTNSNNRVPSAGLNRGAIPPVRAGQSRAGSVYTDRNGNVYRNNQGQWQQRQNNSWRPVNNTNGVTRNLSQQQQQQARGQARTQNFQSARPAAPSGGYRSAPSGGGGYHSAPSGGARSSGGGGGHSGGGRH
jgi:hypothetical protein